MCRGSGYSWAIDNFHDEPPLRQQLGQGLSYGSINVNEDPFNPNRLYAAVYAQGVLIYEGDDVTGPPTNPPPRRSDFDADGDCDLADFGIFQVCFNGPNRPAPIP